MLETEWLRMSLPPLILSRRDLEELLSAAGEEASLELPDESTPSIAELKELGLKDLAGLKVRAPGVTLSLGRDARSTELAFDDEPATTEVAERVLQRLNACRRHTAILTHTDGAIFAGMLLPIAAGVLAPASLVTPACMTAAGIWMIYLVWAQGNAHRSWCVFRNDR